MKIQIKKFQVKHLFFLVKKTTKHIELTNAIGRKIKRNQFRQIWGNIKLPIQRKKAIFYTCSDPVSTTVRLTRRERERER